eukprot:INCI5061.1.p1 GENE.INCI5061.1~~INCI5061.1.p1  ORF type:complete len:955 (+),score=131.17 INCI5061.1:258-2867(+)
MRGVRGFNDRAAPPLAVNGETPFYQPTVNTGPNATSCHGTTCAASQQGQRCWPGTPGAENRNWTCCFGDWVSDITQCPTSPPDAENCLGTACPAAKQGQRCTPDTPGAHGFDWTCCFSEWLPNTTSCPSFPPPATSCDGAATQQECSVENQTCPAGTPGAGTAGNRCCGGWWNSAEANQCPSGPSTADYMLPFHVNLSATSGECMAAPQMDYPTDHAMWNNGRMDSWNTARDPGYGMGYFVRDDLPYYYALADGFTIGDAHFQSTFTQTSPNRMHLFSGSNNNLWNAAARGSNSSKLWMMMDNTEPNPGFDWPTMGETLEAANISWRVYMEEDNFDDNGFAWFANFQAAKPGDVLYDKGMERVATNDLVLEFANDVSSGKLPSVSWIVAPANQSEHATNHPAAGEDLTARLLEVLQSNPDVYAHTAFILNYDEGGQFFDHLWTPTPPASTSDGASTVETTGEITTAQTIGVPAGNSIGMGFRVPLFVISPWTRVASGGAVYSEVVDHTSVVQFIERRFNVTCPNISPWRRAVAGDLLHAFDFTSPPDYSWPDLPDTSSYVSDANRQCNDLPSPQVPKNQAMPVQEKGTKLARPLPYSFVIDDALPVAESGLPADTFEHQLRLTMKNVGAAGAVFYVFDFGLAAEASAPRKFTVEAGKELVASPWQSSDQELNIALYGPNGFVRRFEGNTSAGALSGITFSEQPHFQTVTLKLENPGQPANSSCGFVVEVVDAGSYGLGGPWNLTAAQPELVLNLSNSSQWYNFVASTVEVCDTGNITAKNFKRTFMGKMEGTGVLTTTDPAMGFLQEPPRTHLPIPPRYIHFDKTIQVTRRTEFLATQNVEDSSVLSKLQNDVCRVNKDACKWPGGAFT